MHAQRDTIGLVNVDYPRVGFIVTNMSRPAERVVAFYNKRGTCEQWIKEGKGAFRLGLHRRASRILRSEPSCFSRGITFARSRQYQATADQEPGGIRKTKP